MTSEAQRVGSQKRFGTRHPGPETPNRIKRRTSTPGGGRELQATAIGNQPRRPRPPLCARVIAGAEARVVEERGAGGRTGSEADGDRKSGRGEGGGGRSTRSRIRRRAQRQTHIKQTDTVRTTA